jgi:hypothetical protein
LDKEEGVVLSKVEELPGYGGAAKRMRKVTSDLAHLTMFDFF